MKTQLELSPHDKATLEKDFILSDIAREWHEWQPLHQRVLRTAGLDAQLNLKFAPSNARMDNLLDELFAKNVEIAGHAVE